MYALQDPGSIASPALLVYRDIATENIRRMIAMAGGPERLMPHVKTHKMAPLVAEQLQQGITRFKCATFAEAQMLAEAGAKDILMAYQLNSPTAEAFAMLAFRFQKIRFASLVDNIASARLLNDIWEKAAASRKPIGFLPSAAPVPQKARVYIDIDCGQHRTGIAPSGAAALWRELQALPHVEVAGLHAYDGHIRETDMTERTRQCNEAFAPVAELARQMGDVEIIAGGSPTFPIHLQRPGVICSPGTSILWDEGYRTSCPEQDFTPAALLLTRVISKPQEGYITLDLGHKAVSAENPITKRVFFKNLGEYEVISQSEEHLVVKTPQAASIQVGDVLYGLPYHVCPTVALYNEATVIRDGKAIASWPIARGRRILNTANFSTK
ncbi:D-TA family PLP-dependent enzyme [Chitinophaga lutea]